MFTAESYTDVNLPLPLWEKAFTLYEVNCLNESLTITSDESINDLPLKQQHIINRLLRIICINSNKFVLRTNLYKRIGLAKNVESDFITHQQLALDQYEKSIMDFWGAAKIDYSTISIHSQIQVIKGHLHLTWQTLKYRFRKDISKLSPSDIWKDQTNRFHKWQLELKQKSFADYEGMMVRKIKHLIPAPVWTALTSFYQKIKTLKNNS
jgi:hypothetical protein